MPGPMTPSPQQLSPPAAGRTNPFGGGDPDGVSHADRLWIALTLARAGGTPSTRANTEDAVFRFYLPMARALARSSAKYQDDPEGIEQAAELGLAQAVLAWRYPSGQGFDRAATAAITNYLRQGRTRTTPHPARTTVPRGGRPVPTHRRMTRPEGRRAISTAVRPRLAPVRFRIAGQVPQTVDTEVHVR